MKFVYDGIFSETDINKINSYENIKKDSVQSIIKVSNKFIVNLKHIDPFFGEEVFNSIVIKEL